MEIKTEPACRVGWEGQTLQYTVTAEGASELVVPESGMDDLQVRIAGTREVAGGIEAQVEVDVLGSAAY